MYVLKMELRLQGEEMIAAVFANFFLVTFGTEDAKMTQILLIGARVQWRVCLCAGVRKPIPLLIDLASICSLCTGE